MRLPAEYEPQSSVWLTWPGNPDTWPDCRAALEKSYAVFAATISRFQPVNLICQKGWQAKAKASLQDANADLSVFSFHDFPVNDAWCRDHGPLFVKNEDGALEIVDFHYNAWGGKFSPWEDDDQIPERISEVRKLSRHRVPSFGEGGAIEVNAKGQLITTESVWLNENRNPGWTRKDAGECFARYLGVKETLWLKEGLIGDDTDGHIDTLSRFVRDDIVVTAICDAADSNAEVLYENRERLQDTFTVVDLPHPEAMFKNGERLPSTYANFLILNDAVLVPSYGQKRLDERASGVLRDLFPEREVLGVASEVFIREGGSLHCLSMQEAE